MDQSTFTELVAELRKPEYGEMSDADAAVALSELTVPGSQYVFGSFRTLGALLTELEYNTLRAVMEAAAAAEKSAGGYLVNDMVNSLQLPGNERGDHGGLDLSNARFVTYLENLASQMPATAGVPAKVAAYVAARMPEPTLKFGTVTEHQVAVARAQL